MLNNEARSSRVLTGLNLGPTLINMFSINIPKDDIKSSIKCPKMWHPALNSEQDKLVASK